MKSKLYIQARSRNGKSYIANCYHKQPFKLANITEDKNDRWLRLMVMSSSPGVLDTDDYSFEIVLDEDCAVELRTQSYQRLFSMKTGAQQQMDISLQRGSSLAFIPHPSVPHENSKFTSRNRFHLKDDCFLLWGEVLTCGRKLNGEIFRFSRYQSITEIFWNGTLILKENLMMAPGVMPIDVLGQLEGFTHQASLICIDLQDFNGRMVEEIRELLSTEPDVSFGVSTLAVSGFIVRLLGNKAEQLYNCLQAIAAYVITIGQMRKNIQTASYVS